MTEDVGQVQTAADSLPPLSALAPAHPAPSPIPLPESNSFLVRQILSLAIPVLLEQILNMFVGINDTYLANHLPRHAPDAGAAVGTMAYFLWFIGLLVSSIGTGSSAIIARAKGARHKSLANNVIGQSISAAIILGVAIGLFLILTAQAIVDATRLQGLAHQYALSYLQMLSLSLPASMIMFMANACLRGGGDTLTPAVSMTIVNILNMLFSFALARGWWGLPVMGFYGIAVGTVIAYVAGGIIQLTVLCVGTTGGKLHFHRLRPHWHTIKRLMRIGIPAGTEGILAWLANFAVIAVINNIDATNIMASAHMNTIRVESLSFLWGIAFSTAAATTVGISLGAKNPHRAQRCAYLSYALGGGAMILCGILMITLGYYPARFLSDDPRIVDLTTHCLRITGFIQAGFAASLIFGGATRGAGDTLVVMILNLSSLICLRFTGVLYVGLYLHRGLQAIWIVLATELFIRGALIYARFLQGGWKHIQV